MRVLVRSIELQQIELPQYDAPFRSLETIPCFKRKLKTVSNGKVATPADSIYVRIPTGAIQWIV